MNWTEEYKKEQLERVRIFSRVRGGTKKPIHAVLHKKHDSKSNVFSRCKFCHTGLKVQGVCVTCGSSSVCSYCKKVIQSDRTSIKLPHNPDKVSHGICKKCAIKLKRKTMDYLLRYANKK